jgi:hypothetical protein
MGCSWGISELELGTGVFLGDIRTRALGLLNLFIDDGGFNSFSVRPVCISTSGATSLAAVVS